MTEQEQIISDFKVKCEEIVSKDFTGTNSNDSQKNIIGEINDEANEVINKHSNMPNINAVALKADIDKIVQIYQNKLMT